MKKLLSAIAILMVLCSALSVQGLKFTKTKQNAGMVREGEKLTFEYPYENIGTQPVTINDAKFECTCTSVDYPKEPIQPGQKGMIKITFDTANKMDRQDRIVQLFTSAQVEPYKLRFKCVVLKPRKHDQH
jgi:hypothetical protein